MSLKDADKLTPEIHLSKIIKGLSPSSVKPHRIIVTSPTYMKKLTELLSNSSREVLQTYFAWKVIQAYASVIEADELKPYSRFRNVLQGKVGLEPIKDRSDFLADILTGPRFHARTMENLRQSR